MRSTLQPSDAVEVKETRLWLTQNGERIASGKPDIVWYFGDTAVIPEVKTGWLNAEQEDANLQLRAQAVLVWLNNREVIRVIVALAQAHGENPMPAEYDEAALSMAYREWMDEIDRCNQPDAPRVAGPLQCKYCPAKTHCPEAHQVVKTLATAQPGVLAAVVTLEQLYDACAAAEGVIDKIRAEIKRRLEIDPDAFGGRIVLKPGRVTTPIVDLPIVFARCYEKGISAEQFTAACSLPKKNLLPLLKAATGTKGKALDALVEEIIEGATAEKQAAPSLARGKV